MPVRQSVQASEPGTVPMASCARRWAPSLRTVQPVLGCPSFSGRGRAVADHEVFLIGIEPSGTASRPPGVQAAARDHVGPVSHLPHGVLVRGHQPCVSTGPCFRRPRPAGSWPAASTPRCRPAWIRRGARSAAAAVLPPERAGPLSRVQSCLRRGTIPGTVNLSGRNTSWRGCSAHMEFEDSIAGP